MAETARDTALDILLDIEQKTFSNTALDKGLRKIQFSDKSERAYVTRTVEGVTECRMLIDHILGRYIKMKYDKLRPIVRNVLRLGCYEMLFMDSIPARATISECVKIVKKHNMASLGGFVNAVLRNLDRELQGKLGETKNDAAGDSASNGDAAKNDISLNGQAEAGKSESDLARIDRVAEIFNIDKEYIKYSTPKWLYEYFVKTFGKDKAERIVRDEFNDRGLVIRVNSTKTDREALKERLKEKNISFENGRYSENSLILKNIDFVRRIPGFREGLFSVQAESSSCAVEALQIEKGMKILDLCAAPGGKTCYAAELLGETGEVISRDISEEKLELIDDNIRRLGLTTVKTEAADATVLEPELKDNFDIVIADVPCSGLGVIGKKNDIKYRILPEDLKGLTDISKKILDNAVSYVKTGGRILYSTCTINPGENEEVVKKLLEEYSDPEVKGFTLSLLTERLFIQGIDETDGFYYAVLEKK